MADKAGTERKVWVLPTELGERIRVYQASQGIGSEVEAARRLLDTALQMRDTIEDILKRLWERHKSDKDFRVLARDILTTHPLVQEITIKDTHLLFRLRSEIYGQIDADGAVWSGSEPGYLSQINFASTPARIVTAVKGATAPGDWDNGGGDLDDEIPF